MPLFLPFLMTGERQTEIIKQVVDERVQAMFEGAETAYPDGMLPGMTKLSARMRFARYVLQTDREDVPLLRDPDYLERYQQGIVAPPLSPYWLNILSIPDLWKETAADFRNLYKEYLVAD